jgi:hypothetical protein
MENSLVVLLLQVSLSSIFYNNVIQILSDSKEDQTTHVVNPWHKITDNHQQTGNKIVFIDAFCIL